MSDDGINREKLTQAVDQLADWADQHRHLIEKQAGWARTALNAIKASPGKVWDSTWSGAKHHGKALAHQAQVRAPSLGQVGTGAGALGLGTGAILGADALGGVAKSKVDDVIDNNDIEPDPALINDDTLKWIGGVGVPTIGAFLLYNALKNREDDKDFHKDDL